MTRAQAHWIECDGVDADGERCESQCPTDLGSPTAADALHRAKNSGWKVVLVRGRTRHLCKHCVAAQRKAR